VGFACVVVVLETSFSVIGAYPQLFRTFLRLVFDFHVSASEEKIAWGNMNLPAGRDLVICPTYVYTVTPTSIKEATGAHYNLLSTPYGVKGLVVTWE
jgi:hypothetical protein